MSLEKSQFPKITKKILTNGTYNNTVLTFFYEEQINDFLLYFNGTIYYPDSSFDDLLVDAPQTRENLLSQNKTVETEVLKENHRYYYVVNGPNIERTSDNQCDDKGGVIAHHGGKPGK